MNTKPVSNAGIRIEEVSLCPICQGKGRRLYEGLRDRLYHAPGVWGFSHCVSCDSLWLNPRPRREDIYKCYIEYFTHSEPRETQSNLKGEKMLDAVLFGRRKERDRYYKMRLLPPEPQGRLLDVGCGNGSYLNLMQSFGWDVVGCEADPEAARIGKEYFGLKVIVGTVEDIDMSPNSFDAITLSHVIEHTPDPRRALRRCFCLLKNGGRLSLITPNTRSVGHHVFRDSWYFLDPPRHFVLFSLETLNQVVRDCGFRILKSGTAVWCATNVFGASSRILSSGMVVDNVLSRQDAFWARFTRIFYGLVEHYGNRIFRNIGEEIGILAVKDE